MVERGGPLLDEFLNTLAASWWHLRLVRWFGQRELVDDGRFLVTVATWRGRRYFLGFRDRQRDETVNI